MWGYLFNSVMAEASDFNFGTELGLAGSIIKSYRKTKVGVALLGGVPNFGVSL